jgi:hypothetical protein
VSVDFRNSIIVEYLAFMLALGWEPNEIIRGASVRAKELHAWSDLFVNELKRRFLGDSLRKRSLREAFDTLDRGKRFVFEGRSWLEKEMFG